MEPFDDPVLGHVEWNERFGHWFARIVLPDGAAVDFDIEDELNDVLPVARAAFTFVSANEAALREQLAEQMLETANDWRLGREPIEPEITVASFAARVKLAGVSLADDGGFTLTYSDGEMFGGHAIVVSVGANRVMGDPDLWG